MKKVLLFFAPVILGLMVFFTFVFFFSSSQKGVGALQVTAVPVSNVYLNGKLLGKTPLCRCEGKDTIAAGDYTIKLVPLAGDNLFPYETHITVTKGILTVVDRTLGVGEFSSGSIISLVPLADSKATQLYIASFPTGVTVSIDGNAAGSTPLLVRLVTDSDHELSLSKDGYVSKAVHVHAVAGYELKAIVTLAIASQNATAEASFQNASLTPPQKTTITILDTPTGFLRVRAEPSLSASETAQVKPGNTFDFVSQQDGWYEIKLSDGSTGWISTQYAQKK